MAKVRVAVGLLSDKTTTRHETLREALTAYSSWVILAEGELRSGRLDLAVPSSSPHGGAEPAASERARTADAMQGEITEARRRVEAAMAALRRYP